MVPFPANTIRTPLAGALAEGQVPRFDLAIAAGMVLAGHVGTMVRSVPAVAGQVANRSGEPLRA